jgi:hypothetical protein
MKLNEFKDSEQITFFLPTKADILDMGGAQLLFLQIAEYVAEKTNLKVNFIDVENGRIATKIKSKNIKILFLKNKEKIELEGNHVIITSLANIKKIAFNIIIYGESRLFLWNLGISDFTTNLGLTGFYNRIPLNFRKNAIKIFEPRKKQQLEELMYLLINRKAVAFMSGKNYIILNKYLSIVAEPIYLPVGITNDVNINFVVQKNLATSKITNIGWLGRFSKIETIIKIIDSIAETNINHVFHIIGWGKTNEKEKLINYSNQKSINIKIVKGLYNQELNEYILKNIDLGIAMGLSLLNFASLKIPVIATEYIFRKSEVKNTLTYKWFFELKNYDLATSNVWSSNKENMHPLEFFINQIKLDYKIYSEKCFKFYLANYSFSSIVSNLLDFAGKSELKEPDLKNIKQLLQENIFQKINN